MGLSSGYRHIWHLWLPDIPSAFRFGLYRLLTEAIKGNSALNGCIAII